MKRVTPKTASAGSRTAPTAQAAHRRLRIGLMLRAIDEVDGSGVYARQLCDALFALDTTNEYVLFYMRPDQAGRYGHLPHVRERVVPSRRKLLWDQVLVPLAARRESLDVLFHYKLTIPLLAPCPTVVQQRGVEQWLFPEFYDRVNRFYMTRCIPLYCRRATRVLTNSDSLAEELRTVAGIARDDVQTVYAAPGAGFEPVIDTRELARVRDCYGLPSEAFLLVIAKGYARLGEHGRRLYPRKNIAGTLDAYARVRASVCDCPPLVIMGAGLTERLHPDLLPRELAESVVVPGLIAHEDMPAVYSMARALVFPSLYESFGIPIVEAMACGCPTITSDRGACREVAADAALLVDPTSVDSIADAIIRIVENPTLACELRERGLARARDFSWTRSAQQLLDVLTEVARG
ncbi:MAG TPA: glycosyltransferase family 1 protein [Gemmatimonadaceae bacterium]